MTVHWKRPHRLGWRFQVLQTATIAQLQQATLAHAAAEDELAAEQAAHEYTYEQLGVEQEAHAAALEQNAALRAELRAAEVSTSGACF